jgi:hypothetical protein
MPVGAYDGENLRDLAIYTRVSLQLEAAMALRCLVKDCLNGPPFPLRIQKSVRITMVNLLWVCAIALCRTDADSGD